MKEGSEDDVGEGDLAVSGNQVTEAQGGRGNAEARRGPQEGLLPWSTGVATVGVFFIGVAKSACFPARNCSLGVSGVPSSLLPRVGSATKCTHPFASPLPFPFLCLGPSHVGTLSWRHPFLPCIELSGQGISAVLWGPFLLLQQHLSAIRAFLG